MGLFNFDNNYINQLANNLIFSQIIQISDIDKIVKLKGELIKNGKRASETILIVLDREKNNPNTNWYFALTTLIDIIRDRYKRGDMELLKNAISIYQQSISKNLKIYELLQLYDYWTSYLTNFAHQELVKIGNNNFDNFLDEINCHIKMLLKHAEYYHYTITSKDIIFLKVLLEFKNNISSVRFIIGVIVDFGSQVLPPLTNLLFDSSVKLKKEIARTLGEIGDQRALQPLTRVLQDTDLDVRIRAHESIEKICKTHNLNPQQFIQQSQSKNKDIIEIKNNPNQVNDPVQRLKKVKELLDMGAITKEEFERKKKQLLDEI